MQLSNDTMDVLKNFSTINPNLVIESGQKIQTISESKTVMAMAEIVEDFPNQVGIYDLNEFLSVLNLIDSNNIEFADKYLRISSTTGNAQKVTYYYSNPEILTTPSKDINMPDVDVGVTLDAEVLSKIKQASNVLGHNDLSIVGKDGVLEARIFDAKDNTANDYTLLIESDNTSKGEFNFDFNIANLKLIPGDYFISLSSKKISHWQNTNFPVEYFVALEQSTNFNV
jgi:hypothetical protein